MRGAKNFIIETPRLLPSPMRGVFVYNEPKRKKRMDFTDYQTRSRATAQYPTIGHSVIYPTLGLVNEAGEVAGKIKKVFRDKGGEISAETRAALKSELGDVLWYVAQVCTELDLSLDDVAEANLAKLFDRQARGQIRGDGDNR